MIQKVLILNLHYQDLPEDLKHLPEHFELDVPIPIFQLANFYHHFRQHSQPQPEPTPPPPPHTTTTT